MRGRPAFSPGRAAGWIRHRLAECGRERSEGSVDPTRPQCMPGIEFVVQYAAR